MTTLPLAPLTLPTAPPAAIPIVVLPPETFSKPVTSKSLPSAVMAYALTFLSDPQALHSTRLTCKAWAHLPFQGRHLDLSGYKNLSDDQLQTVLEQLKGTKIQSINLHGCSKLTNQGLKHLLKLTLLTSLNLSECKNITNQGLEHLSKLSALTSLNLSQHQNMTNLGLEHLSKLTSLTSLDLTGCNEITDRGLEHLSKLTSLTSLNLAHCYIITEQGLEHLSKLASLTSLNLWACYYITDQGLEHLSKLTWLTSLNLGGCYIITHITDQGVKQLSKLISLTSLDLSECDNITDRGLEHLSKLTSLSSLDLSECDNITDRGLEYLLKLTSLSSLDLRWCDNITDQGIEHLSKLTSLTSLNLEECSTIRANATAALQAGLMAFMHITPTFNPTTDYYVYQLADAPKGGDKWGEQHRYDDLERLKLAQAITLFKMTQSADPRYPSIDSLLNLINQNPFSKETIHPLLQNLPEGIRNLMYYQIYALSPKRQDQDHWGENHCFDDQSTFKSAAIAVLKGIVFPTYLPKPRTNLQIVR